MLKFQKRNGNASLSEPEPETEITNTPIVAVERQMAGSKLSQAQQSQKELTATSSEHSHESTSNLSNQSQSSSSHGPNCRTCPRKLSIWRCPETKSWKFVGQSETKEQLDSEAAQSLLSDFIQCRTKTLLVMIQDLNADWSAILSCLFRHHSANAHLSLQLGTHYPSTAQKVSRESELIRLVTKIRWKKMYIFWVVFRDHKQLIDLANRSEFVKVFGVQTADSPYMPDYSCCDRMNTFQMVTKQRTRLPLHGPVPYLPRNITQLDLYVDLPAEHEVADWFSMTTKSLSKIKSVAIYVDISNDPRITVQHCERVLSVISQSVARMIGVSLNRAPKQSNRPHHLLVKFEIEDWQPRSYRSIIFGIAGMVMQHTQSVSIAQNDYSSEQGGLWKVDSLDVNFTNKQLGNTVELCLVFKKSM